jgi:uncharacterized protein
VPMEPSSRPWYREPWPWLLMSGPAIVVLAGLYTTALAIASNDGVVADDYYKQGLAINRVLERERHAAALGVGATLRFNDSRDRVRVALRSSGEAPAALRLALLHATMAGEDQEIALVPIAPGLYEGALRSPRAAAWRVRLEDARGNWRLTGAWRIGEESVTLRPAEG